MSGKAVVHIGIHKTGTTSFQYVLAANAAELAKHGFRVFETSIDGWSLKSQALELSHLCLRPHLDAPIRIIRPDIAEQDVQDKFREHIAAVIAETQPVVIFSHEDLSLMRTKAEVAQLAALMAPRDVTIVICTRNERDFLQSWRQQLRRMGMPEVTTSSDSVSNTEAGSWLTSTDTLIQLLGETFGSQNVVVLRYEDCMAQDADVVPSLLEAAGISRFQLSGKVTSWMNSSAGDGAGFSKRPGRSQVFMKVAVNRLKRLVKRLVRNVT